MFNDRVMTSYMKVMTSCTVNPCQIHIVACVLCSQLGSLMDDSAGDRRSHIGSSAVSNRDNARECAANVVMNLQTYSVDIYNVDLRPASTQKLSPYRIEQNRYHVVGMPCVL